MRTGLFTSSIAKIYASNFLTGLVFWYGIEKLFMQHIGITPFGIGVATVGYYAVALLADVPAGLLADKWSRKGVLVLSTICLLVSSVICGTSHSLWQYIVGYMFYGLYIVCTSGTYQALTYDTLHEQNRAGDYSKIIGRAYALFMVGAGVANIGSGLIAHVGGMRLPFLLSVIPCALNAVLILTIAEPQFHKREQKERVLRQLGQSIRIMARTAIVRSLVVMWCVFAVAAPFEQEFSQLYMLRFTQSPIVVGFLWAAAAAMFAIGSWAAHRARKQFAWHVAAALVLLIALGLTTHVWGLALFFGQIIFAQVAFNHIETHVQHATPSGVRTSVMSVLSSLGRVVELPCAIVFGWLINRYGIFVMLRVLAVVSAVGLLYWVIVGVRRLADVQLDGGEEVLVETVAKP
ncbi:MAG TPA: MFS transporter [Candidatus Saccharimonadales bacterium]|nr:MFS transporter [Candidatus Saccharimonadales bacterium]